MALCALLGSLHACGDDDATFDASSPDAAGLDAPALDAPAQDAPGSDAPGSDAPAIDAGSDAGEDAGPAVRPIGPRPVTPTPLSAGTIFAAPDGTGTDCTEAAPCDLWEATDQAEAGDVVFMRGGVYDIDRNLYFRGRGTDPAPVVFESYPGETAVLDGSRHEAHADVYIRVLGDATHCRLFEVRNMPRSALSVRSSDHVLEGLHVHHNLLSGIHVHESYDVPSSNRNLITDCLVHDNSGAGIDGAEYADGGNSDGISMSSGIENRIENCLVYANSDDGIDTWRTLDSYVGYSITHGNGIASGNGQGFKSGGAPPSRGTTVEHSISYDNRGAGFDQNSGVAVEFFYNTSWNNDGSGFYGGDDTVMQFNLAGDDRPRGGTGSDENNSWQREGTITFVSTDPDSPDFLVPTPGSPYEDLGAHANR